MNLNTKVTALALSAFVVVSPALVGPSYAEETKAPVAAEQTKATTIKTMAEVYDALKNVRATRIAIFDGNVDVAKNMVMTAQGDLVKAKENVESYALKNAKASDEGEMYLPFDSSVSLVEGFLPSKEKQPAIEEANGHLANGDNVKAIEVLRLANVDVTVSAAIIPLNKTVSHVNDAVKLINEGKFYEANLALKAVEDSVFVDAYSIDEVPSQGN
ncbi:MAG: YfdX family protein [Sulfitobacter sp.]